MQHQKSVYEELREYWRALFLKQRIKGYLTWDRFDARHYAIADSLQDVGGVMAIYQRACQLDPSPEIAVNADIMFGYSPSDSLVEKKSGSQISYHIAVGYFGDHRFDPLKVKFIYLANELGLGCGDVNNIEIVTKIQCTKTRVPYPKSMVVCCAWVTIIDTQTW